MKRSSSSSTAEFLLPLGSLFAISTRFAVRFYVARLFGAAGKKPTVESDSSSAAAVRSGSTNQSVGAIALK